MLPALPSAISVSSAARVAYVLQHFRQAYEPGPAVSIGYAEDQPQVEVVAGDGGFFAGREPYPPAPSRREWQGRTLPFFFDAHPQEPLLSRLPDGRVRVHADVLAGAFYLLSGWQEYFSEARDRHGRFPYQASVQHRYGFVLVPVVNYYFEVLRAAVELATGQPLRPRRWGPEQRQWAAFITHDIDNLHSAWKSPAKAALRRRDWLGLGRHLWWRFTRSAAWHNLDHVLEAVGSYQAKSTVFFLLSNKPVNNTPNSDYPPAEARRWKPRLEAKGAEVGLHGSLGTAANARQLHEQANLLFQPNGHRAPCRGTRFHYLSWEPRLTPRIVERVGFAYDTTLGFSEHFGFRHSYCHPFQLFNFELGRPYRFLEVPLNVMDATLHHPRYLQLAPEEILPALLPMLQETERFGGLCTILWHNENFDPANTQNGPREFHALMRYLRSRAITFVNGQDICELVNW